MGVTRTPFAISSARFASSASRESTWKAKWKGVRDAEPAVDAGVVLDWHPRDAARLHEGDQLPATGVEEDVADAAALLELEDVAAHRRESEDVLVERARLVEIQRGQSDV
jgi:hypothetical protein